MPGIGIREKLSIYIWYEILVYVLTLRLGFAVRWYVISWGLFSRFGDYSGWAILRVDTEDDGEGYKEYANIGNALAICLDNKRQ